MLFPCGFLRKGLGINFTLPDVILLSFKLDTGHCFLHRGKQIWIAHLLPDWRDERTNVTRSKSSMIFAENFTELSALKIGELIKLIFPLFPLVCRFQLFRDANIVIPR